MPKPTPGPIGEQIYEALGWWASQDEDNDWTALVICDAIAKTIFEPIYEVVAEGPNGERGWSLRLDPEKGPANGLLYLSQWVGAVLTPEMDEAQRRAEIQAPTGWKRGQLASIKLVAQRALTGTKFAIVHANKPEVGWHYIRTLNSETPSPAREKVVLRAAIPAWSALDYEAIEGVSVADVAASAKWETVADLAAAWSSVEALTEILPTDL